MLFRPLNQADGLNIYEHPMHLLAQMQDACYCCYPLHSCVCYDVVVLLLSADAVVLTYLY